MTVNRHADVTVIGAGFSGLSVAYELAMSGASVTILESESEIGGLAAAFDVGGTKLDRFYHHWFTNDLHVMGLIQELGIEEQVVINPTNTGVYYANQFYRLSTPWDLLNFKPLGFWDRIRLGLLALRARRVRDWKQLEELTAEEWLRDLGGENVYRVVWEPLLKGKFGAYAKEISAVWFWNKLKLRGGSRGKSGEERLAYFRGGFVALAESIAEKIRSRGGQIKLSTPVSKMYRENGLWYCNTPEGTFSSGRVVATTALPLLSEMIKDWADPAYCDQLNRIRYIGNVCLVLELEHPLSETYWLNVNDPSFPFVGVIEHTNFEKPETYEGQHIVYLSKYLPHTDPIYGMSPREFFDYAIPYLRSMFPAFEVSWVRRFHHWSERWSQPVVEKKLFRIRIRPMRVSRFAQWRRFIRKIVEPITQFVKVVRSESEWLRN